MSIEKSIQADHEFERRKARKDAFEASERFRLDCKVIMLQEEVLQLKQAIAAQPHVTFNGGYPPVYCCWDSNSNCRKLEDCTSDNCVWTACQP